MLLPLPPGVHRLVMTAVFLGVLLCPRSVHAQFAIGHINVTYSDPARGGRAVPTDVYYPAAVGGENQPVAPGEFPVIAFGHGFLISAGDYDWISNAVVPAGYIVALPRTEGGIPPDHLAFGRDLAFLVTQLQQEGAAPASRFYQHVAPTSCVMGHSMGGGASFLAAAEQSGITALANFAAAETNPSAIAAAGTITIPALLFAGSRDCVTPPSQHQIPLYEALASECKTYLNLTGASHCQFCENNFLCNLGEGGCDPATLSRAQQQAITIEFLRPWLAAQLSGDLGAWEEFQDLVENDTRVTAVQQCALAEIADLEPISGQLRAIPNPSTGEVALHFQPASEQGSGASIAPATLEIFDSSGRVIHTGEFRTSTSVQWDGRDLRGRDAPPGVYFARAAGASGWWTTTLIRLNRPILRH